MKGLDDILIEKRLKSEFTARNNHPEYEAFIDRMVLTLDTGASRQKSKRDSELVSNQVSGKYQKKEPQLIKFLQKVIHHQFYSVSINYSVKICNLGSIMVYLLSFYRKLFQFSCLVVKQCIKLNFMSIKIILMLALVLLLFSGANK